MMEKKVKFIWKFTKFINKCWESWCLQWLIMGKVDLINDWNWLDMTEPGRDVSWSITNNNMSSTGLSWRRAGGSWVTSHVGWDPRNIMDTHTKRPAPLCSVSDQLICLHSQSTQDHNNTLYQQLYSNISMITDKRVFQLCSLPYNQQNWFIFF